MSTTLTLLPKRANRDIIVLKLTLKGQVKYYPWYMKDIKGKKGINTSYELNKRTDINFGIKSIFNALFKRETTEGIYSYPIDNKYLSKVEEPFKSSYVEFLKTYLPKNTGGASLLLCVIPKGSLYYECINSRSFYNYKMIPQLVSKSIIPKKDITNNLEEVL